MANHLRKRAEKLEVPSGIGGLLGGTQFDEPLTVEEALVAAGLDWDIGLRNVCAADKMRTKIPGYKCVHRTDNDQPLGVVKQKYRPISNRDCFGWIQEILKQDKKARIAGAGLLRDGQRVWMAVEIGRTEPVKGDELRLMMVVTNSNDASSHWLVHLLPFRPLSGTVTNLHYGGGFHAIRHTKSSQIRLQEIAAILMSARKRFEDFADQCARMGKTKMTPDQVEEFIFDILRVKPASRKAWFAGKVPVQPHWVKQYEAIISILKPDRKAELESSDMWTVLAACCTYFDHVRTIRGAAKDPDVTFESRMTGYSAKQKFEAYNFALRLVNRLTPPKK